ncbi:MAG: hypothetical protein KF766_11320 [Rhodocyclaceae bacterium]|nr:hypothetical protein [Rhodocyclaceae bacterium]
MSWRSLHEHCAAAWLVAASMFAPCTAKAQQVDSQCLASYLGYYAGESDEYKNEPHLGLITTVALTGDGGLEVGQKFINTTQADKYDETYVEYRYTPVACSASGLVVTYRTTRATGGQHLTLAADARTNLRDRREYGCFLLTSKGLGTKVFGPTATTDQMHGDPTEDEQHAASVCRALAVVDPDYAPGASDAHAFEQALSTLLANREFASTRFSDHQANGFSGSLARAYALNGQFEQAAIEQEAVVRYWKTRDSKQEAKKASDRLRAYKRKKLPSQ